MDKKIILGQPPKGEVTGEIRVSGTLEHPFLKGRLESLDGEIKKLKYNRFLLNIEGDYPRLRVDHSLISRTDGMSFTLAGMIDLSDRANFKRQIKSLTLAPVVVDSGAELEWTIRRFKEKKSAATELKYLRRKDPLAGKGNPQDSDMLGVERTIKF